MVNSSAPWWQLDRTVRSLMFLLAGIVVCSCASNFMGQDGTVSMRVTNDLGREINVHLCTSTACTCARGACHHTVGVANHVGNGEAFSQNAVPRVNVQLLIATVHETHGKCLELVVGKAVPHDVRLSTFRPCRGG